MQTDNPEFWNQLYNNTPYMFGEEPNAYLVEKLASIPKGRILLPGDGEGRNAVYCAKLGWEVFAFDLSEIGRQKANALAIKNNVSIHFETADVADANYPEAFFDVIALIFAHFSPETRRQYHRQLLSYLKPGGFVILEGFSRANNEWTDIRFNLKELKDDFESLELIELEETVAHLHEGMVIQGENEVLRLFGKK